MAEPPQPPGGAPDQPYRPPPVETTSLIGSAGLAAVFE
ncbi:hypothetical protein FB384_003162 [Prauserella sediminis]|uniref:Uncharacterized protein n=1 Tax=Prauserella sediminis TaxID=577680 RepID=A0A839XTB6_9PSEU|nr:hypothetical protein [Prauserella sediminis]